MMKKKSKTKPVELATLTVSKKVHQQLRKAALDTGMTLREYTEKALKLCFKL